MIVIFLILGIPYARCARELGCWRARAAALPPSPVGRTARCEIDTRRDLLQTPPQGALHRLLAATVAGAAEGLVEEHQGDQPQHPGVRHQAGERAAAGDRPVDRSVGTRELPERLDPRGDLHP